MIESEENKIRVRKDIEEWCDFVKVTPLLRNNDISSLVNSIMGEFYHISLYCGHLARSIEDGVLIEFYEYDDHSKGTVQGIYCKDCAEEYKKTLGAWEVKLEVNKQN